MANTQNKDAFFARMNELAQSRKAPIKESRILGTLVDVKRAANGVAYGIIKEQHLYHIKKGGLKKDQDVADFAYIGGLSNITEHQYPTLAVADKNRNFMLATINEGLSRKVSKTGSKKKILTEDKAGKEIGDAEAALPGLEAATDAAAIPAEPVPAAPMADDGAAEMDAGVDAMPADAEVDPLGGGEEMPADLGADPLAGDGEVDPLAGDAEADPLADAGLEGGEEEVAIEEPASEATREIEKSLGKLTNTLRKTELTDAQVKNYVNTYLAAFKDKFPDIEIEDRKAMAEKITKVVPDEDIAALGQSVEDEEGIESVEDIPIEEPEMAEEKCSECGGFAQYAESRGYTAESIMECGEEEMTNLVSGYANAHGEGQNDGDFKVIALVVTPEIIEKLKGDYGHDDFANQVEPFANEMNETSAEDKEAQITEIFGGLKHMAKKAGAGIKQGAQAVGQGIKQAGQDVAQGVQQAATNVKQTYHAGEKNAALGKLEKVAAGLGQKIAQVNKHAEKSGEEPINVKSILSTISNQVAGSAGTADLSKFRTNEAESISIEEPIDNTGIETLVNEIESISIEEPIDNTGIEKPVNENDGIPVDSTEVLPPSMEEDVTIKVGEKKGKALSAEKAPEVEMKEGEEPEGEDIDAPTIKVEPADDANVAPEGDDVLDLTKRQEPEMSIKTGFEPMGGGVVKPDGAEITTVEVTKDSVNVTMNENERKLRKYIRNRLEESAGLKKANLNEGEKSKGLQKLDRIIAKQFKLHEAIALDKIDNMDEAFGFGVKERFASLDPNDQAGIETLFQQAFNKILINPKMAAIGRAAKDTPTPEKYEVLNQYVQQGGGTLRLKPKASIEDLSPNTIEFATADVQQAATPSKFTHGGTQGKTQLGGV